MRITVCFYLIGALFLLSGCVVNNIQDPASLNTTPDNEIAYLFGSFLYSERNSFARLALEIENVESGETFLIEMRRPDVYSGLEFYPFPIGRYRLTNFVRLSGIGELSSKHEIAVADLREPFPLCANHATYIGHYDGKTTRDVMTLLLVGPAFADNDTQATKVTMRPEADLLQEIADHHAEFLQLKLKIPLSVSEFAQQNEKNP